MGRVSAVSTGPSWPSSSSIRDVVELRSGSQCAPSTGLKGLVCDTGRFWAGHGSPSSAKTGLFVHITGVQLLATPIAERGRIPAGVGESPHSQPPSHRCAPRHPTLYRVGSYASPQSTVWGVRAAVQCALSTSTTECRDERTGILLPAFADCSLERLVRLGQGLVWRHVAMAGG